METMKQTCISISTSKNLVEAEQIAKNLGMEIVLRSDSMNVRFSDLSSQERLAYAELLETELRSVSGEIDKSEKVVEDSLAMSRRYLSDALEIVKSFKNDPDMDLLGAIEMLNMKRRKALEHFDEIRARFWRNV